MSLMPFRNAWRLLALAVALTALAPAVAHAKIIELGATETQPKPSCPAEGTETPCRAVSRVTGYQNRIGAIKDPFVVPRDGRIVAWTLVLARPTKKEQSFFNAGFGGEPQAAITVLKKAEENTTDQTVTAQSGVQVLTDYLGKRVQFPLVESLPVLKGERVALTVPTWAPVLAYGFPGNVAWRASRSSENEGCDDFASLAAMRTIGGTRPFQCYYNTARLTYSVTLITEPRITKEARKRQKEEEKAAREEGERTSEFRSAPLGVDAAARLIGGASAP